MCYTFAMGSSGRHAAMLCAVVAACASAAACSASSQEPVERYPALAPDPPTEPGEAGVAPPPGADAGADVVAPPDAKQLVAGPVQLEDVTSDGALVFFDAIGLRVLPPGGVTPVTVAQDFDFGYDERRVSGRFVAAWLSEDPRPSPLHLWSKTGGVEVREAAYRDRLVADVASDALVYAVPASSLLQRTLRWTRAGQPAAHDVVTDLDTGLVTKECRPTVAFAATHIAVAGCPGGSAAPRVATYATDGSGVVRTVLTGSAPGMWLDRARTHALVQTSTASSIRSLTSNATPVALDGPVVSARFSDDDAKVVVLLASGAVKRASTSAPAAPVELAPAATALLSTSADARFVVVATQGDASRYASNLVLLDAATPGAPRELAPVDSAFYGLSTAGDRAVWLERTGVGLEGRLRVAQLPSGAPVDVAPKASRVVRAGDVVYWQEWDAGTKTSTLKAARLGAPTVALTVATGLDALTTDVKVVGARLFVGSKAGLWEMPAVTP
ncbi:MAG: hypothetical protein KC657_01840 [Myxococcales bacterium]|nr:hypothetical protein [Myxococcales bacterium]